MNTAQNPYLKTAIDAAKAAAEIIRFYYQRQPEVQLKADQSPVTIADIEAEKIIRQMLHKAFPEHGFFGEEMGEEKMDSEYIWLIDPIDGTKSFVRQYPFFSTQIALLHQGELVVGVSNAPEFGELAYAAKGEGACLNERPLKVSNIQTLAQATLSFGNIGNLSEDELHWQNLGKLIPQFHRVRGYGDFYHYHLLAAGKIDLVIESDVNILDIAALTVIVREAGGILTDLQGAPPGLTTTSVLAANNTVLHDYVYNHLIKS